MKKILLAAVSVLLLTGISGAFSTKGQDCSKCHSLKKEEAAEILKTLMPDIKVLEVRASPMKSMWEVDVEAESKKAVLYLDFSKRYVIQGQAIDIKDKVNLTRDRLSEINKVDVSKIPVKDALLLGSSSAKKKIIVFTDPDCPFCSKLHVELKKIVAERKDIAFLIKLFPLPMHKEAFDKAKAIVCENSLALLEEAFDKKPIAKPKCKTTVVDKNIELAKKLGISGTPALILPNGKVISGYMEAAALKALIDKK